MKDLLYNLILASIGLFIVYVIFSNYLGTDKEGFEVDDESTTTYDPDDAVTEAGKIQEQKEDANVNKADPDAPTQVEIAQSAQFAKAAEAVGGEIPNISPPTEYPGDSFQNLDDDNSSKNSDDSNNNKPVGVLQKIYSMIFGNHTQEGFVKSHHWLNKTRDSYTRFRNWSRSKTRRWRWRRRRRHHHRRAWRAFHRRRNWYYRQWRKWNDWNASRLDKIRKAKIQKQAAPYINLWRKTKNEKQDIKNVLNYYHTRLPHTVSGNKLRKRMGNHTWREYAKKLRLDRHHPWNNNHWRWRGGSYLRSIEYWMHRKRVRPGKAHHHWEAPSNAKQNAIKWAEWEIRMKRKADEEAKRSNLRKANWPTVEKTGTKFLGQFQDNKKMSKADEVEIQQMYGLTTPIKDWDKKNIENTHEYITQKYNKIQDARANALKAKAAQAFAQKQAAMHAAQEASNAAAALAHAEKKMAADAAAAQAKAAAENAAAARAMGSTFTKHVQKGRDNTSAIQSRVTPMAQMNKNTIAAATSSKATIDDLLTLQGGRLAKVNAVPMEAIKKISLKARQNYDKSIATAAQG